MRLTGRLWLDPLLAIGAALNILREGAHLAWRSIEGPTGSASNLEARFDRADGELDGAAP